MAFISLRLVVPRLLWPHSFSTISITSDLIQLKSTNVNVLDTFTADFLSRVAKKPIRNISKENMENVKINQNNGQKSLIEKITLHQMDKAAKQHSCDIHLLSRKEFDQYVNLSIENDDRHTFSDIVEQMIIKKLLPSDDVILRAMSYLVDDRSEQTHRFTKLINVCIEMNITFYATNQHFLPYLAQYYWEANQFEDALKILRQIYGTDNKTIKNLIENNFKKILQNSILQREEDVIVKIEELAINIYRQHKESSLLVHVWNKCFISDWFIDQKRAKNLFENYNEIRKIFAKGVATFVFDMLQRHKVEAVHRLIELCLSYDMEKECFICLSLLFDYQYWKKNVQACAAIGKTCIQLDRPLSDEQNQQLIDMMIDVPVISMKTKKTDSVKASSKGIKFKF